MVQFNNYFASFLLSNRPLIQQPISWMRTTIHMVMEQGGYDGDTQMKGKEITLDQLGTKL